MVEQRIRNDNEGEKPSDVIRGYALMGYSKIAVCQALKIHKQTLNRIVRERGIVWPGRRDYNDSCKKQAKERVCLSCRGTVTDGAKGRCKLCYNARYMRIKRGTWTMNDYLIGFLVDKIKEAI